MKSECVGKPIQSHTIAKSLGLNDIAEDGHVLVLHHDFSTLNRTGGKAELAEKGVNRTSVFPGFCAYHDSRLFKPIENKPFEATSEQCGLLSYRALARERFTKLAGIDVNEFIKSADKGRPAEWQMLVQQFAASYGEGLNAALRDLDAALQEHYDAISKQDFGAFESAVYEFEEELPVLCVSGHFPSEDWQGKQIQDLVNVEKQAAWLTAASIRSDGRSFVVFTWSKKDSGLLRPLMDRMIKTYEGREADALVKYFFTISENVAVRPSWWRGLGTSEQKALQSRIMDGVPMGGMAGANIMRPKMNEPIVGNQKLGEFSYVPS
jgi:hypothetical protein